MLLMPGSWQATESLPTVLTSGGGGGTMSDGDTTEMSVMTEVSDLEVILEAAAGWDFVDTDKMALLGTS